MELRNLLLALAEIHHDEMGLRLPTAVAPFRVHLLHLPGQDQAARETAAHLERELEAAGVSVLYDDRDRSPGVKLKDADLIGVPIRLVVSSRSLADGMVELRSRASGHLVNVPIGDTISAVQSPDLT
jgi:prolyl-tRNA synthetase